MKRLVLALGMAAVLAVPTDVHGQEQAAGSLLSASIGATAGLVAGGYANLAVVVLKARAGNYQHSFTEAFGWESIPIPIGAGTGFAIGFWDEDRLWPWILGGTAGFGVGAGAGYLTGALVWGDPESKWADAAIGAAVGMTVGSTIGLLLAGGDDNGGAPADAIRVRLIRVHF